MDRFKQGCILAACCLCLALWSMPQSLRAVDMTRNKLILSVEPYLPASELEMRFTPLADYLSAVLGRPVEVLVALSHAQHLDWVERDLVDFAFVSPARYLDLVARSGVRPLLGRLEIAGQPSFEGSIFVRSDSPVQDLEDMHGVRMAFGDEYSTMGYLVPRKLLEQAGVTLYDLEGYQFLANPRNVVLAVLAGHYQAGSVRSDIFQDYRKRGLRLVATSPRVSEHLFVARHDLDTRMEQALRNALLTMNRQAEGLKALQAIKADVTGIVAASDCNYDSLRDLLYAVGDWSRGARLADSE